jgi:hypothetical protein
MRILFDQGTPGATQRSSDQPHCGHRLRVGLVNSGNGKLLAAAEDSFDLFITTDQQLRYQQNLVGRQIAILVLLSASWPHIRRRIPQIQIAIEDIKSGDYREVTMK